MTYNVLSGTLSLYTTAAVCVVILNSQSGRSYEILFIFVLVFLLIPICVVVSTSAVDCLKRLVSEMSCYVSSEMLNPAHSLTPLFVSISLILV